MIAIAAAQSSSKKNASVATNNPFSSGRIPGMSMSLTGLTGIVKKKNKDESEKRVNAMKRWAAPVVKKYGLFVI